MDEYLTTEEVAEVLRTTPATVRYWHATGRGPESFKVGRRRLYTRRAVETFIARAQEAEAAARAV